MQLEEGCFREGQIGFARHIPPKAGRMPHVSGVRGGGLGAAEQNAEKFSAIAAIESVNTGWQCVSSIFIFSPLFILKSATLGGILMHKRNVSKSLAFTAIAAASLAVAGTATQSYGLGFYEWYGTNSTAWTDASSWWSGAGAAPTGGTQAAPVGGNIQIGDGTLENYALTYDPTNNTAITDPTYIVGDLLVGHATAGVVNVLSGNLTFEDQQYASAIAWDGSNGALNVSGGATVTFQDPLAAASNPALTLGKAGGAAGVGTVTVTGATVNIDGNLLFNYQYGNNTISIGQGGLVTVNNDNETTAVAGTTTLGFGSHIILSGNGMFEQTASNTMTFYNHSAATNNSFVAFQMGGSGTLSLFDGTGGSNMSTVESQIGTDVTSGQFDIMNGSAFTPITSVSQLAFNQSGSQLLVTLAPVPEPATLALFMAAGVGLLLLRKRKTA